MKNITRIFTLIMALCLCLGTMTTNVFAAENISTSEAKEVDYLNYDFPDGAEILYQGVDGVIYSTASTNDFAVTRAVQHNQVWLNAGSWDIGTFNASNPHRLGGKGFGRLRLESTDSSVQMQVMVSNGGTSTYQSLTTINVGTDITFDFNSISSELVVHYWPKKVSSQYGMRLNCWLS